MTLATIINSDLIPFRQRGMYQVVQNGSYGFGAICGASFGGTIVDTIGWRWCFTIQVPVSMAALVLGYFVLKFPAEERDSTESGQPQGIWHRIDLLGACLLVLALSSQLVGLSLGGNELPWSNIWVVSSLVGSVVFTAAFVFVEAHTKAAPLIPLKMLYGLLPVSTQVANVCVGMSAYAVRTLCDVLQSGSLTISLVPVYPAAALPGGLTGQSHEGWRSIGHPISRDSSGWVHIRGGHVSLGQAGPACAHRGRSDVYW